MIKRLALVLVIIVLIIGVILMFLNILDIEDDLRIYIPIDILNIVFISLIAIFIACIAAKSFIIAGSIQILALGSGALAFGISSLFRGWMLHLTGNTVITGQDCAVFIASILHLTAAILLYFRRGKIRTGFNYSLGTLIIIYSTVLASIALISLLASKDITPSFFTPEGGTTILREIVRGLAVFFFMVSSLTVLVVYRSYNMEFHYWYALGLMLFGFGVLFISQGEVESMIELIGRIAQYIGGIYILFAVISNYKLIKAHRKL